MAEHSTHGAEHGGHGNLFKIYMIVAGALAVATASSFAVNQLFHGSKFIAFVLILGVAIIKATLVGMYFMHLKWDWNLLYFLIGPIFILAAMMAVVFLPDGVLGPRHDISDGYDIRKMQEERLAERDKGQP